MKKKTKITLWVVFALLAAALAIGLFMSKGTQTGSTMQANAQNFAETDSDFNKPFICTNQFGYDDICRKYYIESGDSIKNWEFISNIAEKIKARALNIGDHKAYTLGHYLILTHYLQTEQEEHFKAACDTLRYYCDKHHEMFYYYLGVTTIADHYASQYRLNPALEVLDAFRKYLNTRNDEIGWIYYYRMMGRVYSMVGLKEKAKGYMQSAINHFRVKVPGSIESILYRDYAMLMPEESDSCSILLKKALEVSHAIGDSLITYQLMAIRDANRNNRQSFMANHDKVIELYKKNRGGLPEQMYYQVLAYGEAMRGNKKEAYALLPQLSTSDKYKVYEFLGEYENAFQQYKNTTKEADSINIYTIEESLEQYVTKAGIERAKAEQKEERMSLMSIIIIMIVAVLILCIVIIILMLINSRRKKQYIEKLQKAKNEAEDANRKKDVFVQNMSHEIRTPLNALVGFSQLLAMPADFLTDEEREEYANYIGNSSSLLTMYVDDILTLSNIENHKYQVTKAPCTVNTICRLAIKTSETKVKPGVKLFFTSALEDTHTAITDANRVQQILVNFISNACKHTTEGHIELRCNNTDKPGTIKFIVEDTGPGIPADKAEAIFERFVKLNTFVQGTGLGLNICKVLSKYLDGRVYLDTSYTGGARFVFEIPDRQE